MNRSESFSFLIGIKKFGVATYFIYICKQIIRFLDDNCLTRSFFE